MKETLPIALKLMFGHEGGYVNVKTDRGGPTKYGITHRTLAAHRGVAKVSAAEVRALTLTEAEVIYRKEYWEQSGGDVLPEGLDYAVFDFGVNSGPTRAVKALQKVLGVSQDGVVGPGTLKAVEAYNLSGQSLIKAYCDERMRFLRSLKGKQGFESNGRGWTIRVTGVDPKGEWKTKPGVLGHALELTQAAAVKANTPPVAMRPTPIPNPTLPDIATDAGATKDTDVVLVDGPKKDETQVVIVKTPKPDPDQPAAPPSRTGLMAIFAVLMGFVAAAIKYFGG